MIMATIPDRKRTMTKEFMMLQKHKRHSLTLTNNTKSTVSVSMVHNVKTVLIPKPLNVGVRHGDQDVVPSGGPLDRIVFL